MSKTDDYRALLDLLPFYANGTLGQDDRARFLKGLEDYPQLNTELERELKAQDKMRAGGDAIMAEAQDPQARLGAALAKLPDNHSANPASVRSAAARPKGSALAFLSPKYWVPAVGLSLCAAVALQASVIADKNQQISDLEEKYQSAGGPGGDCVKDAKIMLELKDSAPWSAVADLLDTEKLRIVDSGGFGTLTLASEAAEDALPYQIKRLKASPLVANADLAK